MNEELPEDKKSFEDHEEEDSLESLLDESDEFIEWDENEDGGIRSQKVLTKYQEAYLMKFRLENLYEKIDKTFDELLEVTYLEKILKECNLGESHDTTPSLELRKLAVLEASRVNMPNCIDSRFDDLDDDIVGNIDHNYIQLLNASWLNTKSVVLITNQGKEIGKEVFKSWNFYKIFPPHPPKFSLDKWLDLVKKRSGKQELSDTETYYWKEKWLSYQQERVLNPSSCQEVILHIKGIVTSPIYEDMIKTGKRQYQLKHGIQLKETDKTFVFTIPFHEFESIPNNAPSYLLKYLSNIQVAFILPEYAHERTRYFSKKGANLDNFFSYLNALDVGIPIEYLQHLRICHQRRLVRFYRECLRKSNTSDYVTGYFLAMPPNIYGMFDKYWYPYIKNSHAIWRRVSPIHDHYPEWMCKMGGVIIEPSQNNAILLPVQQTAQSTNEIFAPSQKLLQTALQIPPKRIEELYVAELRAIYRVNPKAFTKYAVEYCESSSNQKSKQPANLYETILEDVLKKVYHARHP